MLVKKVYAEGVSGKTSTTKTADDRAYTSWATSQAAGAGIRNPQRYVQRNAANNTVGSRNRTMGQVNRNR